MERPLYYAGPGPGTVGEVVMLLKLSREIGHDSYDDIRRYWLFHHIVFLNGMGISTKGT